MLRERWMGIDLRWILEAFETQLILIIGLKDKTERVGSVNFSHFLCRFYGRDIFCFERKSGN